MRVFSVVNYLIVTVHHYDFALISRFDAFHTFEKNIHVHILAFGFWVWVLILVSKNFGSKHHASIVHVKLHQMHKT